MKKIKVAHVLHSVGGVDVSLRLILENLDPSAFQNFVLHGTDDASEAFLDCNSEVIQSFRTGIIRNISPAKDLVAVLKAIKILNTIKPDVIHAHSAKGGIIGRIAGRILRIPVVYTPQAFSYLSAEKSYLREIYLLIEKAFRGGRTYLLASSSSERNRGLNEVGFKSEKALVFNNCIRPVGDIPPLSIKQTWPDKYICTVGRPSFQKNIEMMLDVISEVKKTQPVHLVLMGVGHHSGKLKEVTGKIEKLSLTADVTMLEWTRRTDIFNIIKNSQLYISTARYEGLPYSVIESLALGIPAVVTDCDGNRDLIIDGHNGFVIPEYDVRGFADAVIRILNDKDLARNFSKNAVALFEEEFNIHAKIGSLEEIYKKVSVG